MVTFLDCALICEDTFFALPFPMFDLIDVDLASHILFQIIDMLSKSKALEILLFKRKKKLAKLILKANAYVDQNFITLFRKFEKKTII
uniref:Uncharacterized protein n=1 Tax=Strongyloides papillosus TaxID=174720 RepID=A0A0N5BXK7_STREA